MADSRVVGEKTVTPRAPYDGVSGGGICGPFLEGLRLLADFAQFHKFELYNQGINDSRMKRRDDRSGPRSPFLLAFDAQKIK